MESNWRWNIAEQGWSASSYGLMARVSNMAVQIAVVSHETYDGFFTLFGFSVPEQMWVPGMVLPIPTDHPHFPYGIDVLPD